MRALDIVNYVIKKYPGWNYYNSDVLKSLFTCFSEDKCREFIKKFWQEACKDLSEWSNNLSGKRIQHIVYLYFLGYYIYRRSKCVKDAIDASIDQFVNQCANNGVKFPYVWFLIVLSHDLFYDENDKDKEILEHKFHELWNTNCAISVPRFLQSKELVKNYLNFREWRDHGIHAGLNVYNKLCEIRDIMSKAKDNSLDWRESLNLVFNEISKIILAHNIWFLKENREGNSESVDKYREYHLDKLLLQNDDDYKVSLKEYPLLFLLYLADTIEPIKKFGDFNSLKKVQISVNDKEISVSTSLSCSCAQSFMQSAKDLNDWLTKTTFDRERNKVIISLK